MTSAACLSALLARCSPSAATTRPRASRAACDEEHDDEGHHDQADDGNDVPFDDRGSSVAC